MIYRKVLYGMVEILVNTAISVYTVALYYLMVKYTR